MALTTLIGARAPAALDFVALAAAEEALLAILLAKGIDVELAEPEDELPAPVVDTLLGAAVPLPEAEDEVPLVTVRG